MRNPGKFTLIVLLAGAIFSALISIYAFDFNVSEGLGAEIVMFILMQAFVLLPYTLLYLLWWRTFQKKATWGHRTVLVFTTIIVAPFHIYAYIDALFISSSSTAGLVFFFVPFYSIAGIIVAYYFFSWILDKRFPNRVVSEE